LIYIAFFTLTGASLSLDILVKTWPIAIALVFTRTVAIFIGSFIGGVLAKNPNNYNSVSWMAYITQAGVSIGLAKEVVVEFPEWGNPFVTIIIAVIVFNPESRLKRTLFGIHSQVLQEQSVSGH
jgi:Kef-type K+ transport system membrane component KefB